jgi:hypothetical protein
LRKVLPQFEFDGSKLPEGIRRDKNNVRRHSSAKAQGMKKGTCAFQDFVPHLAIDTSDAKRNASMQTAMFWVPFVIRQ